MAIVCEQAISHIQYCQLGLLHYLGAGYLTFIISTALLSPLSLSSQMAIVCEQAISHIQYCQLGSLHYIGAGYLTFVISTALHSPLSLLSSWEMANIGWYDQEIWQTKVNTVNPVISR